MIGSEAHGFHRRRLHFEAAKRAGRRHAFRRAGRLLRAAIRCSDEARITPVVTTSDLEAGYAADGYARTKGLGAVSVAYGVGTLSMINAIAGAYVERSPVVVINGGPTAANLSNLHQYDIVFSHSIGQDATDLTAYKLVTANALRAATVAEVPG